MCEGVGCGVNHIFSKGKFQGSNHLMDKNFQEEESKSSPDKEKGISGNKGKQQTTLQVPCGFSTAILSSTLEASVQAKQSWGRRKKSGNTRLFWDPRSTNHPQPIHVGQARPRCPVQHQHQDKSRVTAVLGRILSLSSRRSPGNRAPESQRQTKAHNYSAVKTHIPTNSFTPRGHRRPKPKHNWLHMVT